MQARIYQPAKTAMQSGRGKTKLWVLEFEPARPREIDPLMGWTSSGDMNTQVILRFESEQAAVAYAEKNGIPYQIEAPKKLQRVVKAYADNFKYGRLGQWTH